MGRFNLSDYTEVKDRIPLFLSDHPDGRIVTEILAWDRDAAPPLIGIKARLFRDHETDKAMASGIAYEKEGTNTVNRGSYVENCETSAIGRALANANYTGNGNRPSREEMQSGQDTAEATPPNGLDKMVDQVSRGVAKMDELVDAGLAEWPEAKAAEIRKATVDRSPTALAEALEWLKTAVEKAKLEPTKEVAT